MPNRPIMAILYDFDKTLCSEDMQNYSLIPALGMTPAEFWGATNDFTNKEGVERILSYMYMMVKLAKERGIKLTKEFLNSLGKDIHFFEGVPNWFKRINEYGAERGINIEHYIVSSGTKEIIDGSAIASEFKAIYGCEFYFDEETGEPLWPKLAINYTMKTQYFFRIAKGVFRQIDDHLVNERSREKRIPYRNIVYIGDGLTDVPPMILVKENGGKSIAVYSKGNKEHVMPLIEDSRVNYICQADYRSGSELDKVIKLIIQQISITEELTKKEITLTNK